MQWGIVVKLAAKTGNTAPAHFHYLNPGHALISSTYGVFLFPAIKKGGMEQGGVERVGCEELWHVRKQLELQSCLSCNETHNTILVWPSSAGNPGLTCQSLALTGPQHVLETSITAPQLLLVYSLFSLCLLCIMNPVAYSTLQQALHDEAAFWSFHTKEYVRVDQMNSLGGTINCTVDGGSVLKRYTQHVSGCFQWNKAKLLISFHTDSSKAELGLWIINIT